MHFSVLHNVKGVHSWIQHFESIFLYFIIQKNNLDMVHALIVFGADVNAVNMKKESPRHIATTPIISSLGSYMGSTNHIISALHLVGAKRCPPGMQGCSAGCKAGGTYNGNPTTANTDFTQLESNKGIHCGNDRLFFFIFFFFYLK